jgi:hypothetical protein
MQDYFKKALVFMAVSIASGAIFLCSISYMGESYFASQADTKTPVGCWRLSDYLLLHRCSGTLMSFVISGRQNQSEKYLVAYVSELKESSECKIHSRIYRTFFAMLDGPPLS